ncbi:MAG: GTPase [Halioglobus sp.]
MAEIAPIKLQLPDQDLEKFEFFELTAEAAHRWIQELPGANARQSVQQLQQVISQLNRLKLSPGVRFNLLEAMRATILVATSGLSRNILNQPLALPEEARQLAQMADTLFGLAGTGYALAAVHTIQQRDTVRDVNPARLVCEALHRAISFNSRKILQSYQLYQPIELQGWLSLHQLYALAERQQLAHLPIIDPLVGDTSITATYLQPLLMACCKPNQLRQSDIAGVYRGLREWSELARIDDPATGKGLFLIDLNSDQPPFYSELFANHPGAQCRYVDTEALVANLNKLRRQDKQGGNKGISFDKDTHIPSNLLDHLIGSMGAVSKRNFSRSELGNKLWIGVGLSNVHFHLAGGVIFENLLHGASYTGSVGEDVISNQFMVPQQSRDLWGQANPEEDYDRSEIPGDNDSPLAHEVSVDASTYAVLEHQEADTGPDILYPAHPARSVNASPGGYCLEWEAALPRDIKIGDLTCVREDNSKEWVVSVIRWISQIQGSQPLMGVELLSPRAIPYGAKVRQKDGSESQPMRALLLPEIKLVGQPHTLITPRSGFKERQKITLLRDGEEFLVQLQRQVAATSTYLQFDFRYIKQLETVKAEQSGSTLAATSFNSVWDKL